MHLIYSKLKSANVMSGKIKGNPFLVEFKPDKKNRVPDDQFEALLGEEESALKFLLGRGDFVEDAESATAEISGLQGDIKKLQAALKKAEDAAKIDDKDVIKNEVGVNEAEKVLYDAEGVLENAPDAESKKKALSEVNKAKKVLGLAKKAAKKAAKG